MTDEFENRRLVKPSQLLISAERLRSSEPPQLTRVERATTESAEALIESAKRQQE